MFRTLPIFVALALLAGCAPANELVVLGGGMERSATPEAHDGADTLNDEPQSGGDDDDNFGTPEDDGDGTAEPVDAPGSVTGLSPAPGSTAHHYRAPIVITFDAPVHDVAVELRGPLDNHLAAEADAEALGQADPGCTPDNEDSDDPWTTPDGLVLWSHRMEWNDSGTRLSIWPAVDACSSPRGWLLPDRDFEVSLIRDTERFTWSFRTSLAGLPLDTDGLSGTYAVDWSNARFAAPAALGPALEATLGDRTLLLSPDLDDGELTWSASLGTSTADQDACAVADSLAEAGAFTLDGSYFEAAPGPVTLWAGADPLRFESATFSGDLARLDEDGTPILDDGTPALLELGFSGWLRADSLSDATGLTVEAICAAATTRHAASCETCPSGDSRCLWVELDRFGAAGAGPALDSWTYDDLAAEGTCDLDVATVACSAAAGHPGPAALLLALAPLLRRRR